MADPQVDPLCSQACDVILGLVSCSIPVVFSCSAAAAVASSLPLSVDAPMSARTRRIARTFDSAPSSPFPLTAERLSEPLRILRGVEPESNRDWPKRQVSFTRADSVTSHICSRTPRVL